MDNNEYEFNGLSNIPQEESKVFSRGHVAVDPGHNKPPVFNFTPHRTTNSMDPPAYAFNSTPILRTSKPHQKIFDFSAHNRPLRIHSNNEYTDNKGQSPFKLLSNPTVHSQLRTNNYDHDRINSPVPNEMQSTHQRYASNVQAPPTPQSQKRIRSRDISEISDSQDQAEPDDMDFTALMNKKMKEASTIKFQLAEERKLVNTLQVRIASLQTSNDELQQTKLSLTQKLASTESSLAHSTENLRSKDEMLQTTRNHLSEQKDLYSRMQVELSISQNDLSQCKINAEDVQKQFGAAQLQWTRQQEQLSNQLTTRNDELSRSLDRVKETDEKLDKFKRAARRTIEDATKRYDASQLMFTQLKTQHELQQKELDTYNEEILSLKCSVQNGLENVAPILDHTGRYWNKGLETRDVVTELQQSRDDAQQVIDILRSKIAVLGDQFVAAQNNLQELREKDRVRELESARNLNLLSGFDTKIDTLVGKLIKQEHEEVALLIESGKVETELINLRECLMHTEETLKIRDAEIQELHEKNEVLENISRVQAANLNEAKANLSAALTRFDDAEKHNAESITMLKSHLKIEGQRKRDLDVSHEDMRKTNVQLLHQLEETQNKLASEQVVTSDLKQQSALQEQTSQGMRERVKVLERDVNQSKQDASGFEVEMRQNEIRFVSLQERFDSLGMTLKLTKEHSGDLQERLLTTERLNATLQERLDGQSQAIAVSRDANTELQNRLNALATLEKTNAMNADALKLEISRLEEKNSELTTSLFKLEECLNLQRQASAEEYASKLEDYNALLAIQTEHAAAANKHSEEYYGLVNELTLRLKNQRTEFEEIRGLLEQRNQDRIVTVDNSAVEENEHIRGEISRLQEENERCNERERTLEQRYKDGKLSQFERTFVNSVVALSGAMFEQDGVEKDNELRRRDNHISTLQTKVATLEATLAKHLRQKRKESGIEGTKSMANYLWTSASSPPKDGAPDDNSPPNSNFIPDITTFSESEEPPRKFADIDNTDEISEDDDDIPLAQPQRSILGKRLRELPTSQTGRHPRRSKTAANKKLHDSATLETSFKAAEGRPKSRKRR